MELRQRSANSSIVITRLTTCGRTSPFISLRTRSSATVDPPSTSFISHPGRISSSGGARFPPRSVDLSRYDPQTSRFEDSANFRRDPRAYIPTCLPRFHRSTSKIFPATIRIFLVGVIDREAGRIACFDITSVFHAWHRERSERNGDYISHFCWVIHQEANNLSYRAEDSASRKIRMKFCVFIQKYR